MDAWQPPHSDGSYYNEQSLREYQDRLEFSDIIGLSDRIERQFSLTSHSQLNDDLANWIEIKIRKWIRSWGGGKMDEFININPHLQSIHGRTGFHLRDINYVICNDLPIQNYLKGLTQYSPAEQTARVGMLLYLHPKMRNLHFATRGAVEEVAALMYKLGIDKFFICPNDPSHPA